MADAPGQVSAARPTATVLWVASPDTLRARALRPGQILSVLARARRTAALFGSDHPVVLKTMAETHEVIGQMLATRQSLRFSIHEDAFFVENTLLLEESLQLQPLLLELRARDIGAIEIHAGVTLEEMRSLVELLNLTPAEIQSRGGPSIALERLDARRIVVGPSGPPREDLNLRVDPREAYSAGLQVVDDLTFQASRDLPLDLRKARLVLNSLSEIITKDKVAMLSISALKNYDEDSAHHSVNVSILSLVLGVQFELSTIVMTTLGLAALLHDIGKVRVPREILTSAGKLTAAEMEQVRRHTFYGAHTLRNLPGVARLAMVTAFEHHANYDLSGYPEITAKTVPHFLTRIIQVADFFDAATSSRRVYRRPMLPNEAMTFILDRAGKMFDPVVAKVFVRQLGLYPVGSVVELDTEELAVVIGPGEREVTRPVIKVVRDHARKPIDPYTISLEAQRERRIVRAVDSLDVGIDSATAVREGEEAVH